MRLQVLGIGNAFTAKYYNTSFLVESHALYLVDAPPALFRILLERGVNPADVSHVIVTHVHGDHTSGLETLLLWKRYFQRRKLTICSTCRVMEEVRQKFFPRFSDSFSRGLLSIVGTNLEDYADFFELKEDAPTRLDDELQVEVRYNWHPTPTLGLKFIGALGTVGISGDTCYRPPLLRALRENKVLDDSGYAKLAGDWLWRSDLIYHEAERGGPTLHTLEADLLDLPAEIRRKLRLIHVPDGFAEEQLPVAVEGETVTFSGPGEVRIELPAPPA
jgi:hypothetical protein